jgi:hypothetical protein
VIHTVYCIVNIGFLLENYFSKKAFFFMGEVKYFKIRGLRYAFVAGYRYALVPGTAETERSRGLRFG